MKRSISRRDVAIGAAITSVVCNCGLAFAQRHAQACSLRGATADVEVLLGAERTPWLQASIVSDVAGVETRFESLFFADADVEVLVGADAPDNAYAIDGEYIVANRVLLGEPLIRRYRENLPEWWRLAVTGVVAHEYAHLWQMNNLPELLAETEPHELAELHADYLAGYALSFFKREQNIQIASFARELYALGDLAFNSAAHHGTPEQRMAAMIDGYRIGIQPATPPSLEEAASQAIAFVRRELART